MRIALLSDTHIPTSLRRLPQDLLSQLRGVDCILHAGDLVSAEVLGELETIAPTKAVAGNMDPVEVASGLPSEVIMQLGGWSVGMKHGHQSRDLQARYLGFGYDAPEFELFYQAMTTQLPGAEIIVFGHFHAAVIKKWNAILFINPGAVAPSHGPSSFAILDLGDQIKARIIDL